MCSVLHVTSDVRVSLFTKIQNTLLRTAVLRTTKQRRPYCQPKGGGGGGISKLTSILLPPTPDFLLVSRMRHIRTNEVNL